MKNAKRLLSLFLALVLLAGVVPAGAFRAGAATTYLWPVINGTANSHGYNCTCNTHKGKHTGQDIGNAPYGQAILSPVDGKVTSVYKGCRGRSNLSKGKSCSSDECSSGSFDYFKKYGLSFCNNGIGNGVTVKDDTTGYSFTVAHMAYDPIVKKGDTVKKGQVLGFVGESGCSAGIHLHLSSKNKNNKSVDPMSVTFSKPKTTPSADPLAVSGVRYPKNKKSGDAFGVTGVVSSNAKITSVQITVVDCDGKTHDFGSAKPAAYYYDLNSLDSKAAFSTLKKAGTYTYKIKAVDETGAEVLFSKSFTVGSGKTTYGFDKASVSQVVMPTASTSGYQGGVTVTLDCQTKDAKIYYTTDGSSPLKSDGKTPAAGSILYKEPFDLTSSVTMKIVALKDKMTPSTVSEKKITVDQTAAPSVSAVPSGSGYSVDLTSATKDATIFYTLDGSDPVTAGTRFDGVFTVADECDLHAVAVKTGMAFSIVTEYAFVLRPPEAPVIRLTSPADLGVGDAVRVEWPAVKNALDYDVTVTSASGQTQVVTTGGTVAAVTLDAVGTYTVTVSAGNAFGRSSASNPLTVEVHKDVAVTFADDDGAVLDLQYVKYGGNAVPPVAPSKPGHTFSGWNGIYTNVRTEVTVTAEYIPEQYKITFVDVDGAVLAARNVNYGESFPAEELPVVTAKPGYVFLAWVVRSGPGSSYECVNGEAVFEPSFVLANPDLPLYVTLDKAERKTDSSGYDVCACVTNLSSEDLQGKLIVVIKTSYGQMLVTNITNVTVPAEAEAVPFEVTVPCKEVGSTAEAYIVANDKENANKTGGPYSPVAAADVTVASASTYSYWDEWSDWQTAAVSESDTREVETKTQYSYRDKETTTSTSPSLDGWTQSGSSVQYGAWGSWSGWSLTSRTKNDTTDVETRTVYYYFHYCNGSGGIAPSTSYTNGKYGPHEVYNTTKHTKDRASSVGYRIVDGLTKCAKGCGSYYYGGTKTQYRYRTRTKTTVYSYWRWGSWSEFSDAFVSASDNKQVQTRTLYRYRDLITVAGEPTVTDLGQEKEKTGTEYRISGTLENVDRDYAGKTVTVMVYKERNIDPTEEQMEHVTQITLGEGNTYDFTFLPKEEISLATGDYIVSFGVATADRLINNVERIAAPKPVYDVTFKSYDGSILETQQVEQGADAVAPELEAPDGYEIRWNRTLTNITRSTEITAVLKAKTYTVIFVDWANSRIVKIDTDVPYGSQISFPADCTAQGKVFTGWSLPQGSTVSDTMVIEAQYEDVMLTVTFLNRDGSAYLSTQVPYGGSAGLPETAPTEEGYRFVAWNSDTPWWNVEQDVSVEAVFVYEQTVETPVITFEPESNQVTAELSMETSTEDAEIRYTLDGTEPTEEDLLFTDEPIYIEEDCILIVKAFKTYMNPSAPVEVPIDLIASSDVPAVSAVTDVSQYEIGADYAKICMKLENPQGYKILSYGYSIVADTEDVYDYENTSISGAADTVLGRVFTVGNLLPAVYVYTFFANIENVGYVESAPQTFVIEASDAGLIDAEIAKETGTNLYVSPKISAAEILALAEDGAQLLSASGAPADAEQYVGSGMTFVPPGGTGKTVVVKGDTDGDGETTAADARYALRAAVDLESPTGWKADACMVDGDAEITAADARLILRSAVDLEKLNLY